MNPVTECELNTCDRPPRVLIVDDSALSRQLMVMVLRDSYDVVQATDGREAVDILATDDTIECVVTDDQMPGMSGVEVAKFISTLSRRIPVVMVTAGSSRPTARQIESLHAGVAAFLHKPFTCEQLRRFVGSLVGGQPKFPLAGRRPVDTPIQTLSAPIGR